MRSAVVTCLAASLWLLPAAGATAMPPGADTLRLYVEAVRAGYQPVIAGEVLASAERIADFYESRGFQPAWTENGRPTAAAQSLSALIADAAAEGLRPQDYHDARIREGLKGLRWAESPAAGAWDQALAELELLLSDAYLNYSSHLLRGRVSPESQHPGWSQSPRDRDLLETMEAAVTSGRVGETLQALAPPYAGYHRLRDELARYRDIRDSGGFVPVAWGPSLKPGAAGIRVDALCRRLRQGSDLPPTEPCREGMLYDNLQPAVTRFQRRHGLEDDGITGPQTLAALDVSAAERLQQIELNLERWRWLPHDLGRRHIVVNIAGFNLEVVEDDRRVMSMRVIVGKPYQQTPVFSERMRYLVFSPYWQVPYSIATREILPKLREDPAYLARENLTVLQGWGGDEKIVDPATVDWDSVSAKGFPYRFRQEPGPDNSLGRVKFMFPNRFNVYLHDTPSRQLFQRSERTFSHGCIRIEKPMELAEYLLAEREGWDRQRILDAASRQQEQAVSLPEPVPVHILYWTAWASADGSVQFRQDIYNRDRKLADALKAG